MPSNCVICGNSAMKDPGVSFHRLPSGPERKRQWLAAFDVSEEEWCPHWRVCSRHFPDGNPKSAPHTYQEDQFATAWALRKRTKLNQSSSRQMKRNHLNAILATRAQGALSHPFPVSTPVTVSSTPTSITASKPVGSVHARVPMLLPVASLASSTPGGPITVITTGESLTATQPQRQLEATRIHVHELVVVPDLDPVEESGSESSGSDDSIPGLDPAGDTTTTVVPTSHDESHLFIPVSAAEHVLRVDTATPLRADHGTTPTEVYSTPVPIEVSGMDHFMTTQRANHTIDMSRINRSLTASRVEAAPCSSAPQAQDVSVLVKSALLARIEALENDNHQLKQKLPQPSSPLCVHVTDSSTGRPAEGVSVEVSVCEPVNADWTSIGCGMTSEDGRWCAVLAQPQLTPGLYRVHFDTQSYFCSHGHMQPHYPYVEVVFRLDHYTSTHHVSLQLSPFSYTVSSQSLTT